MNKAIILVTDQLVDDGVMADEHVGRGGIELVHELGEITGPLALGEAGGAPYVANRTPMWTSAAPGGSMSQQLGFFLDGLKPAVAITRPGMPPNGLKQSLQRGGEGI